MIKEKLMQKFIFTLCIFISVGVSEQSPNCPKPSVKLIRDDAQYAVKLSLSWINPKFIDEVVAKNFPKLQKQNWVKMSDDNTHNEFFSFSFQHKGEGF